MENNMDGYGSAGTWWWSLEPAIQCTYLAMFKKENPNVDINRNDKTFNRCIALIRKYQESYDLAITLREIERS